MKLLIYTLLSNILLFLGLCETGDECRDYDLLPIDMYSADIYFDWIYCDDGNEVTSPEIASELHGKTIVITFYKLHCGGSLSAPMEYRYVVEENWIRKLNLGTYTINITNTKEEFWADYRYERSQKLEHYVKQPFTELDYYLTSDKNYVLKMFFGINTGEIQPYCGEGI